MAWLPFSKKQDPITSSVSSPSLEQRAHRPLGIIQEGESDIAHTLDQITIDGQASIKALSGESVVKTNESVRDFVHSRDGQLFIIDGEKYASQSIICTNERNGNKTCLKLGYNSIELFKQMQRLEYFCSLPNDINATYFECRKIT